MTKLTQQTMAASLKRKLSQKTLDRITVTEIADDCEIKRQTFYYHFKDIYDLLEWTFLQEGGKLLENKEMCVDWRDIYLEAFRYIEQNQNFVINVYHSLGREHLERYLHQLVYRLIEQFIDGMDSGAQIDKEDREFICQFYKFGLVGIILDWISRGMKEDPKTIAAKMERLLERHIVSW